MAYTFFEACSDQTRGSGMCSSAQTCSVALTCDVHVRTPLAFAGPEFEMYKLETPKTPEPLWNLDVHLVSSSSNSTCMAGGRVLPVR